MARVGTVSVLFLCLVGMSFSMVIDRRYSHDMVNYINSLPGNTWKAGHRFSGKPMFTGLLPSSETFPSRVNDQMDGHDYDELPEYFDAREKWPECPSIGEIRDQGACGSCWAVAGAAAITDRICIASQGQEVVHVSSEDILSCNTAGCNGSTIERSWTYFQQNGVVSGGSFGSNEGCRPYSIPSCNHGSRRPSPLKPCHDYKIRTPACLKKCQKNYGVNYEADKHYGGEVSQFNSEREMMKDLLNHGPLEVGFMVYSDFGAYEEGIYQHVYGEIMGGHAVKLIGWGEEDGVKYWLLANSWNENWGENGFFRILRGVNECGIESSATSSVPL